MSPGQRFRAFYTPSIISAGFAFALVHVAEILRGSFKFNNISNIYISAVITLIIFAFLEIVVFVSIGWPFAYVPSRMLEHFFGNRRHGVSFCIFVGIAMGLFFLPLCAALAFVVLPPPNGFSYFERCVEFFLPMGVAGASGGYVMWRGRRARPTDLG